MKKAWFRAGESMNDLVARLYEFESGRTGAREAAALALRKANPHLDKIERLPNRTPIMVPRVPGARRLPQPRPPSRQPGRQPGGQPDASGRETNMMRLADHAELVLANVGKGVEHTKRLERDRHEMTKRCLDDRELISAAEGLSEVRDLMEAVAEAAQRRADERFALVERQKKRVAELQRKLRELRRRR